MLAGWNAATILSHRNPADLCSIPGNRHLFPIERLFDAKEQSQDTQQSC
jgi:hypothetical protein